MILWALWRRGLLARIDSEKLHFFAGCVPDRLALSRRYPLWRALPWWRMLVSPRAAAGVSAWLEYRMDLYDGAEG